MKGIKEAAWVAIFVLACFLGVNTFQILAVNNSDAPEAGFPFACYDMGKGYIGIGSLHDLTATFNCLIASLVAALSALVVFALFNPVDAKAIARRMVRMKGMTGAFRAAVFVLACFIGINAFSFWYVFHKHNTSAGFPMACFFDYDYVSGVSWTTAIFNCLIASLFSAFAALSVFVLLDPVDSKAIIQRLVSLKGMVGPCRTAVFVLACFVALNAIQILALYALRLWDLCAFPARALSTEIRQDVNSFYFGRGGAGFPVISYRLGGGEVIAEPNTMATIVNCFIASQSAVLVALIVFVLAPADPIAVARRIVIRMRSRAQAEF